jgi:protein disulfide-isomerase-like protein
MFFLLNFFFSLVSAGDVLELTPANFDENVGAGEPAFVEFFAPWCGHCKNLAPEYEKVATAFTKLPVKVASVDADKHKDLGSRFGVSGFPTLKYFPAGSQEGEAYNGGRTAKDIVDFINKKAGTNARIKEAPTAVTVLTDDNFDGIVKDANKHVLVEFYAPWCGHCKSLAPHYETLANIYASEPDVVIAKLDATEEKNKAAEYGVSGYPTLKWFSKTDKSGVGYEGGRDVESFVNYINENAGTQRTKDGGFLPSAGTISEFDELVTKFKSAAAAERKTLLAELEGKLSSVVKNKEFGKFYQIAMKRIIEKGDSFATSESSRLQRLIDSGSVTKDKFGEFAKRLNIINLFK